MGAEGRKGEERVNSLRNIYSVYSLHYCCRWGGDRELEWGEWCLGVHSHSLVVTWLVSRHPPRVHKRSREQPGRFNVGGTADVRMPEQSNDYRVVVFGAGGVGKSSLVLRFVKGSFRESYIPTIEDTYRQVSEPAVAAAAVATPAVAAPTLEMPHPFDLLFSWRDVYSEKCERLVACVSLDSYRWI